MTAYPDTSFLCAMYRFQANSRRAAAHFAAMSEPLHVASPLLYEFRQSTRWQVFLHSKDRSKGFDRMTAQASLAKLQENIASGALVVVPVDWADVANIAERLSARHTWTQGYRVFDILHVASALHLGASEFLTFDANQKHLAKAQDLRVPL
ncbi:MAG: type II toxin-antitoxin system VapC family toxin [Verrucomicrobia bacterium]|nr:MAG: type II toxin-antitoxin system VapC family toxin [Verrucomicrobiota bacterium]